jgi:NAD(P)-dependent dehydrogenase (short-subunit alcohol dehydrogenase family)
MDPKNTSAIVTGGASGLGEGTARALTAAGAHVVCIDLDAERGEALAKEIGYTYIHGDVAEDDVVERAIAAATEQAPLRSVVNAAGIGRSGRIISRENEPMPRGPFEKVLRVNLIGTFNVCRLAAAAMARTEPYNDDGARGSIVNFASVAAFEGQIGQVAYSASKGGIVGMMLPMARDLATVGIRVNTVAPGVIDTPIFGPSEASQDLKGRLGTDVLFPKRLGHVEELVDVVMTFLTNDYLNAEVIRVDGGMRMPPRSAG